MKLGVLVILCMFGSAGTLTYKDPSSKVIVHYPKGWHLDRSASAFAIINFPDRDRPPQMLVPPGRAMIIFEGLDTRTADEYIKSNRLISEAGFQEKPVQIETRDGLLPSRQLRQDRNKFLPEGHTLMNIFSVRGKLYEAQLIYRGAARKIEYEGIYYSLVKSLEFPDK